jgi:hypothetical protein
METYRPYMACMCSLPPTLWIKSESCVHSINNNNNNLSCNKGRTFAEHGIRRYHAITAQDLATWRSSLGVNVDFPRIGNRHIRISRSTSLQPLPYELTNYSTLEISHWPGSLVRTSSIAMVCSRLLFSRFFSDFFYYYVKHSMFS